MAEDEEKQCWTRYRNDGSRYVTCSNDAEEIAWQDAQDRCPSSPPRDNPSWKPYVGSPGVFHCGYEGYLENRDPTPDSPMAECFYDEKDRLVDDRHRYSGCQGTADQYPASDPRHIYPDRGGVFVKGPGAAWESLLHALGAKD